MATPFEQAVLDAYAAIGRSGIGTAPGNIDQAGYDYWLGQLTSGAMTPQDMNRVFGSAVTNYLSEKPQDTVTGYVTDWNQSLAGQNYDTQDITAAYRQMFGSNPDQEGYQYWLSRAQTDAGQMGQTLRDAMAAAAQGMGVQPANNVSALVAALEADPYAGRYATNSIYNVAPDAVNVSTINGRDAQFVTPVGQTPVISGYDNGAFTATPGQYTLNPDQARAQIGTALYSGALTRDQYDQMLGALDGAKTVQDSMAAFNAPTATVNLGANGMQMGVGGQPVDFASALAQNYKGANTATTGANVINQNNLAPTLDNVIKMVQGTYGTPGSGTISTPVPSSFYSERGLESQYSPLGTGPTFRSGVAGYTNQLPNHMTFGMAPLQGEYPVYQPGSWADFMRAREAKEAAERAAQNIEPTGASA